MHQLRHSFPVFISNNFQSCSDTKPSFSITLLHCINYRQHEGAAVPLVFIEGDQLLREKSRSSPQLSNFHYFSCMKNTKINPVWGAQSEFIGIISSFRRKCRKVISKRGSVLKSVAYSGNNAIV